MTWNNPVPVAVALLPLKTSDGRFALLGIVRARDPGAGGLAMPGGFVDEMESIEAACAREVYEETSLETNAGDWQIVCSRITPQNRVLLFCRFKHELDEQRLAELPLCDEIAGFCRLDGGQQLVFATHQEVLSQYLAGEL